MVWFGLVWFVWSVRLGSTMKNVSFTRVKLLFCQNLTRSQAPSWGNLGDILGLMRAGLGESWGILGLSWAMFGAERNIRVEISMLYEKNHGFSNVLVDLTRSKKPNLSNFGGILGLMRAILGYLARASSAVLGVVWFGLVWFGWFGRCGWEVQ